MRVKTTIALAVAALAVALPTAAANRGGDHDGDVINVKAGESIQAAIDRADPGTTIKIEEGTYKENLLIDKDAISLVGEGRSKTKIEAGGPVNPVCGAAADQPVNGICVADVDDQFNKLSTVDDVHISRLSVTGFSSIGIIFFGAADQVVKRVYTADNHEYGIAAFESSGGVYAHNVTPRNGEAGIYVGSSPNADSVIYRNVAWGNLFGIFIRDASNGKVLKNKVFDNCTGMIFLETAEPITTERWLVRDNHVTANNRTTLPPVGGDEPRPCGGGDEPPLSGIGIAVGGASKLLIVHNGVFGNAAPEGAPPGPSGGIVLQSTATDGGADVTNTKVAFNTAFGNVPDLAWDGEGAGNEFVGNDCLTSDPAGLCTDPDGDGGGDDDGRGNDRGGKKHRGNDKYGGQKDTNRQRHEQKRGSRHDD